MAGMKQQALSGRPARVRTSALKGKTPNFQLRSIQRELPRRNRVTVPNRMTAQINETSSTSKLKLL